MFQPQLCLQKRMQDVLSLSHRKQQNALRISLAKICCSTIVPDASVATNVDANESDAIYSTNVSNAMCLNDVCTASSISIQHGPKLKMVC